MPTSRSAPSTRPRSRNRTEGWPAGVYLAALIARTATVRRCRSPATTVIVSDYLYRESLMRLAGANAALPPIDLGARRLSRPRCVTRSSAIRDRIRRLRDLEASNTFLVPLDRRRGWYRYHALFREFLQGELQRVEPDAVMKLHLRAADWFESNGSPAMAVEHLLNTTERDRCAQLVSQLVLPTYQAGQMSTVQRWIVGLRRRGRRGLSALGGVWPGG